MPDRTRGLSPRPPRRRLSCTRSTSVRWRPRPTLAVVRELLGGPLPERVRTPEAVIEALAAGAEPGLVASAGPRHFGFVIGGSLPAALGADWLVSAWDQCAAFHSLSPASAAIEEIAAGWTLDLLGLPAEAGVGFVDRCAGREHHGAGRRPPRGARTRGLGRGTPRPAGRAGVNVVCGEQAHATIFTALRLLGLGAGNAIRVPADGQGRMVPDGLEERLAGLSGPTIVCAQAGNVATGAFDPLQPIADACAAARRVAARGRCLRALGRGRALHPPARGRSRARGLVGRGRSQVAERALRQRDDDRGGRGRAPRGDEPGRVVPGGRSGPARFDQLRARVLPPSPRRAGLRGPALAGTPGSGRAGGEKLRPRAANGRTAGRDRRRRGSQRRGPQPGAGPAARRRRGTEAAIAAVQRDGTCWLGGTQWEGRAALRVSFSNWATTEADVDRSATAIATALS